MGHREDDHLIALDKVGERERKAGEEKAPDAEFLVHPWPERAQGRPLEKDVQRTGNLVQELCTQTRTLELIPIPRRVEVSDAARVEADSHALWAPPSVGEARADRTPVLGCHGPSADRMGTLLQLLDPRLGGIRIGSAVKAQEELMRDPRALLDRERKGLGKYDVGGLGRHRNKHSHITAGLPWRWPLWLGHFPSEAARTAWPHARRARVPKEGASSPQNCKDAL